jgi:hypothetical protein
MMNVDVGTLIRRASRDDRRKAFGCWRRQDMKKVEEVSEERKAELLALFEAELGLTPESPETPEKKEPPVKVVVEEGEVVRDALVRVAPSDPNFPKSQEGEVRVRRTDFVTVRIDLWEEQQRQKAEDRRHRRAIDPYRMGHWGDDGDDAA